MTHARVVTVGLAAALCVACATAPYVSPPSDAGPECVAPIACTCEGGRQGAADCLKGKRAQCYCPGVAPPDDDGGMPEAAADASPPAEACAPPPIEDGLGSSSCDVLGPCPTCAAGSWYRCSGIRQRPQYAASGSIFTPLPGSRPILSGAGTEDYCAPPACVRATVDDGQCFPSRPLAVRCVALPNGQAAVTPPPTCSFGATPPGAASVLVCCGSS